MTSSRYGFGLSVALSFASFWFLRQRPGAGSAKKRPPAPPPAEDPTQQAADQAAENEQEEAESEAAPEPALTKPEPGVSPEDKPAEPPPPPEDTASKTSARSRSDRVDGRRRTLARLCLPGRSNARHQVRLAAGRPSTASSGRTCRSSRAKIACASVSPARSGTTSATRSSTPTRGSQASKT